MKRKAGILLHVSSLPSQFGIGDFGPTAYRFVDFLASSKQSIWQILPLNPTHLEFDNSPYFSTSLYAINPILISPELLYKEGLIDKEDLQTAKTELTDYIDYENVYKVKDYLIDRAYDNFRGWEDLERFWEENKNWLYDYCMFEATRRRERRPWTEWTTLVEDTQSIQRLAFGQYLALKQWMNLKSYANGKGILILGDLPIYPAHDSVDVFKNRTLFKLDERGYPKAVAGVPPDLFSPTGQLWGNPVYDWEKLKKDNFRWWIDRIRHNLKLFDLLRLDHFRGFVAYYEVPAGSKDARVGRWVEAPATEFFSKIKEEFPHMPFIAEDLGFITPDVESVRNTFELPGMKVLCFAFYSEDSPYMLHNHTYNSVAMTGTHDTMPIRSWYEKELDDPSRARLLRYLGLKELDPNEVAPTLVRHAYMSVAKFCIIPIQDVLNLGEESRLNTPGTSEGNWRWKMKNIPGEDVSQYLRDLCKTYGRE